MTTYTPAVRAMQRRRRLPLGKAQMTTRPASQIPVEQFTLILQWPLILVPDAGDGSQSERIADGIRITREALAKDWIEVDGLDMLQDQALLSATGAAATAARSNEAKASYGEFAYFHNFLQDVLYPRKGSGPVSIWSRNDKSAMTFLLRTEKGKADDLQKYLIKRRTIHLFDIGCAMVSLELEWDGPKDFGSDLTPTLALDRVQRALDFIRRSYPPYFYGNDAARCPLQVTLHSNGDEAVGKPASISGWDAREKDWSLVNQKPHRDIQVFDHWKDLIVPLNLLANGGPWRDPSDERIPINAFIRLGSESREGQTDELKAAHDQSAMNAIRPHDWIRIADAENPLGEPDTSMPWPYNRRFINKAFREAFYDRFAPDSQCMIATSRHIFTGSAYIWIGAGGFLATHGHTHFRRHYTQMSLVARLEQAVLLAISSRLTGAVAEYQTARPAVFGSPDPRLTFERDILDIQDQFLSFGHRFRFTGVSNQIQAREMFEHWRRSLGLQTLYDEVKAELDAAIDAVRARQQEREVKAATDLTRVATIGAFLGVFVAALAVTPHLSTIFGVSSLDPDKAGSRLALIYTLLLIGAGIGALSLPFLNSRNWFWRAAAGIGVICFAILWFFFSNLPV